MPGLVWIPGRIAALPGRMIGSTRMIAKRCGQLNIAQARAGRYVAESAMVAGAHDEPTL
ncbi:MULTISPECIES: hypothetical protein [unclassified Sphingomonas]|uniref:hypothetical protein n=1 Tax=unclassified Sphingomonas TaxID=196159 RepID=UPI001ACC94F3|nr:MULTISPECIES: hypothetical protein [unclassified Sphingomonas]MBN8849077.1 hypothetical protein [Sphingomonas sp.]